MKEGSRDAFDLYIIVFMICALDRGHLRHATYEVISAPTRRFIFDCNTPPTDLSLVSHQSVFFQSSNVFSRWGLPVRQVLASR